MFALASTHPKRPGALASRALNGAAAFWLIAALSGQWAFFYYIAAFYGSSTLTGHFEAWRANTMLLKGYVRGDTVGNIAFGVHALLASVIAFGGALQLIPRLRARAPVVHRWIGRVFIVTALSLSVSGLFLVWVRHSNPSLEGSLSTSLNAVFIVAFAALAWRTARSRDFTAHRCWALRLYLVSNGQWFFRVGVFAVIICAGGRAVPDLFFSAWGWGCTLLPLAILELYLRTGRGAGAAPRLAMAAGLVALTLVMAVGTFGFSMLTGLLLSGRPLPNL